MRALYTFIFIIALPVIFIRLWLKDKKVPGYRVRWPERFGIFPPINEPKTLFWIHAVSVGEVIAATPLIQRLLKEDQLALIITTMTPTGSARVQDTFGNRVHHVYAPYDLPWTVSAFLNKVRPALAIIMETELWPNTLQACSQHNIPTLLANARMSERSARGYERFHKTTQKLINLINHVAVQNTEDGDRFLSLGLEEPRLSITGSIKFDINIEHSTRNAANELKACYAGLNRPVIIAASTHDGEDSIILQAFHRVLLKHPNALLVLVPRHPERFEAVFDLSVKSFETIRRSSHQKPHAQTQVVVGDTMGEMMLLYGCADIAFVGGSLIEHGGHNMIEPACWGVPVLSGPHTYNFADISKRLIECGGMVTTQNETQLSQQICYWLENKEERLSAGAQAHAFTEQNRGALDRLMSLVQPYLPPSPQ